MAKTYKFGPGDLCSYMGKYYTVITFPYISYCNDGTLGEFKTTVHDIMLVGDTTFKSKTVPIKYIKSVQECTSS